MGRFVWQTAWAAVCAGGSLSSWAGSSGLGEPDDLGDRFETSAWTEQSLELPDAAGEPFVVAVRLGGVTHRLRLELWTMRGEGAAGYVVGADGDRHPAALPAARTYRGISVEDPTVEAAGALGPDGLTLTIVDDDDKPDRVEVWAVQPVGDGDRAQHVVHRAEHSLARGACGADLIPQALAGTRGGGESALEFEIEIAIEADFAYFEGSGSDFDATIQDIDAVMAGVILVYERDINATITTTAYVIRTDAAADPYTTTDPFVLLPQLRSEWNLNQTAIHRDVAHLFTGRDLQGSIVGIAYISGLCTEDGYAISQARFSPNANSRVALVAHEIGHNAGAFHCTGNNCHIMCAGIGGCGGLGDPPKFGQASINAIRGFLDGADCVGAPDPGCLADLTGDGVADANDFFLFLSLASDRDPRADLDGDGRINATDFFSFLDAFATGCGG